MIRKITFENFYSFGSKQVIDFTTNKKKSNDYYTSYDGVQISKVAGFIGANGSGKTNVMRIFSFISHIVTKSAFQSKLEASEYDTGIKKYLFGDKKNTKFEIDFETQDYLCSYKISLSENKIFEEELKVKELSKGSRFSTLYKRKGSNISINKKHIQNVTAKKLASIRQDDSLISFIQSNYDIPIVNEVFLYFTEIWTNVETNGRFRSHEVQIEIASDLYSQFDQLKKLLVDFMKNFDLGIEDISFKNSDGDIEVYMEHLVSNKLYSLPLAFESKGTKLLFSELLHAFVFFNQGNVLVFDEIETGLHPNAIDKVIQYILEVIGDDKKQFIFATHSHNFLKKFDSDQIYLVEKVNNSSEVYRLSETGARPDENFYAKYSGGAYGAFPKIRI